MDTPCRRIVVTLALVLTVSVAGGVAALSPDETARLKAGEALVRVSEDATGEADGHIEAAIDIPAPPSRIYAVMLDCARTMKFLTKLKTCKVLEASPDGLTDVREHRSKWLAILPETVSVFRSTYVRDREIRFEKLSGDFKFLKGSWRLEPEAGGKTTRVFYDVRVGISAPVPGFMIRSALQEDVPKLLKGLRNEVVNGKP